MTPKETHSIQQQNSLRALALEVSNLYKHGKYYSVISLVSSNLSYENIPTKARLYLALALTKLGRYEIGLRELAICIEFSAFEERYRLLGQLGLVFKTLKAYDRSAICFNEGIYWLKNNEVNDYISNEKEKLKMIQIFEHELNKCLKAFESDDSIVIQNQS